ncbi:hypothetical protein FGO68_gene7712 [Halteria grandinella]|uniref:Uncharacterized protein n=1 Tax=Halteria grandinella TaxID=5974 RepID=A0A8J8NDJ4_HALGN|nr:hypothetical protein FGO68_gene7712 [Halteria grandinella]
MQAVAHSLSSCRDLEILEGDESLLSALLAGMAYQTEEGDNCSWTRLKEVRLLTSHCNKKNMGATSDSAIDGQIRSMRWIHRHNPDIKFYLHPQFVKQHLKELRETEMQIEIGKPSSYNNSSQFAKSEHQAADNYSIISRQQPFRVAQSSIGLNIVNFTGTKYPFTKWFYPQSSDKMVILFNLKSQRYMEALRITSGNVIANKKVKNCLQRFLSSFQLFHNTLGGGMANPGEKEISFFVEQDISILEQFLESHETFLEYIGRSLILDDEDYRDERPDWHQFFYILMRSCQWWEDSQCEIMKDALVEYSQILYEVDREKATSLVSKLEVSQIRHLEDINYFMKLIKPLF